MESFCIYFFLTNKIGVETQRETRKTTQQLARKQQEKYVHIIINPKLDQYFVYSLYMFYSLFFWQIGLNDKWAIQNDLKCSDK